MCAIGGLASRTINLCHQGRGENSILCRYQGEVSSPAELLQCSPCERPKVCMNDSGVIASCVRSDVG